MSVSVDRVKKLSKEYKLKGYHCSESIIRSINDAFELNMSDDLLRSVCGFRGGGGGYRDRCGIIESGMMLISYIYGRDNPEEEVWKYSYLIRVLHERFKEHFGTIYCRDIYFKQKEMNVPINCLDVIVDGSEIIAILLNEADELLDNAKEIDKI